MIALCPECSVHDFTLRQLIGVAIMKPWATDCRSAGLHSSRQIERACEIGAMR